MADFLSIELLSLMKRYGLSYADIQSAAFGLRHCSPAFTEAVFSRIHSVHQSTEACTHSADEVQMLTTQCFQRLLLDSVQSLGLNLAIETLKTSYQISIKTGEE